MTFAIESNEKLIEKFSENQVQWNNNRCESQLELMPRTLDSEQIQRAEQI